MTGDLIPAPAGGNPATEWQAVYIFYAGSPRPFLVQCARPLIDGLVDDGLITNYFFINYWLEGPHIRLRFKPSTIAAEDLVRSRAEAAIAAFLKSRPSLYEVRADYLIGLYNTMFDLESFAPEERARHMSSDGHMKLRPNNSFHWERYEPEYGKYGGPVGVQLAEWHFRHSTDLVIRILREMNVHIRSVLLGLAAQLMMVMTAVFLTDSGDRAEFLERYHEFWKGYFSGTDIIEGGRYERSYEAVGEGVIARFAAIHAALADGRHDELPDFARGWAAHCAELKTSVSRLAAEGQLIFRNWETGQDETVINPRRALPLLLNPYLHMTNNRLRCTVRDEAMLSYLLGRALRESSATGAA